MKISDLQERLRMFGKDSMTIGELQKHLRKYEKGLEELRKLETAPLLRQEFWKEVKKYEYGQALQAKVFCNIAKPISPAYLVNTLTEIKKADETKAEAKKLGIDEDVWNSLIEDYIDHLKWRYTYPKSAFNRQASSWWIQTGILIALFCSGLFFTGVQLFRALKYGDIAVGETDIAVRTAAVELSFRSSLVGGIVLVVSLVFFFLYLKYVFPINYPVPPIVEWEDLEQAINKPGPKNRLRKAVTAAPELRVTGVKTKAVKKD